MRRTTPWIGAIVAVGIGAGIVGGDVANAQMNSAAPSNRDLSQWGVWAKQTRRMRSAEVRFPGGLGGLPTEMSIFERTPRLLVKRSTERPAQLLLTEHLPPVGAQGGQQSCVGWATAYYMYSYAIARKRSLTPEQQLVKRFQFSPAYLYNSINGGKDQGSQIGKAFELVRDRGVASLAEMPYDVTDFLTKPGEAALSKANRYKGNQIVYLFRGKSFYLGGAPADVEKLKLFLANRRLPFVMAIPIFKDFPTDKVEDTNYVYNLSMVPSKSDFYGLHAVTCVGYDDEKKAFRIVNSWGSYWGDNGYLWLSEDFLKNWASEGWGLVKAGGPDMRGNALDEAAFHSTFALEMPAKIAKPLVKSTRVNP